MKYRSRIRAIVAIVFVAASVAVLGQPPPPPPLFPKPGEVMPSVAQSTVRSFLKQIGLNSSGKVDGGRLAEFQPGVRVWEFNVDPNYIVKVDTVGGTVVEFRNRTKFVGLRKPRKTDKLAMTSAKIVEDAATKMAKAVGVPGNWKIVEIWYDPGDQTLDGIRVKRPPHCFARFSYRHDGYPILQFAHGYSFLFDPVDGALVSMTKQLKVKFGAPRARISKADAEKAAVETYNSTLKLAASRARTVRTDRVSRLGWALPNTLFGGPKTDAKAIPSFRLVWEVPIGKEGIWIDAATGKVIGGVLGK